MEPPAFSQEGALAEAFSDFIEASGRLENSYKQLQDEVAYLSRALVERNQALLASRSEKQSLERRLHHVLETIPCGVLVVNGAGDITLCNPEAVKLLALPRQRMTSVEAVRSATGLDLSPVVEEAESGGHERELCLSDVADPRWLAIRKAALPVSEVTDHIAGETLLVLRDVSARVRMDKEREQAREAVALGQVSALLAHEVRNPLASLELFAGLLVDSADKREEWLLHLRAGIRSLSGTVNNVLAMHRDVPLALERVDACNEVKLAVEFLQPLALEASVKLIFDGDAEPRWALAHRGALHQVLLNLCMNALRHTPPAGIVQVSCGEFVEPDVRLRISVRDTGTGIAAGDLPYIFQAGFSGSGTSCGLGLAVCDRLVRQQQGSIVVTSVVGQGTCVTVELMQA